MTPGWRGVVCAQEWQRCPRGWQVLQECLDAGEALYLARYVVRYMMRHLVRHLVRLVVAILLTSAALVGTRSTASTLATASQAGPTTATTAAASDASRLSWSPHADQARTPPPLKLGAEQSRMALAGHMALWEEDTPLGQALDPLLHQDFRPLAGNLAQGFGSSAIWLRFALQACDPQEAGEWWLQVWPAFINDLTLWQAPDADNPSWRLLGEGGTDHPMSKRPVSGNNSVFVLHLPQDCRVHHYYLRLSSATARLAMPTLFRPNRYLGQLRQRDLVEGACYGAALTAGLLCALLGMWLRDASYWRAAAYVITAQATQMVALGHAQMWIYPDTVGLNNRVLGAFMTLQVGLAAELIMGMGVRQHFPRLSQTIRQVAWLLVLALLPLAMDNHHGLVAPIAHTSYSLLTAFAVVMAALLWQRAQVAAKYYLLAFGMLLIAVVVFILRNIGAIELTAPLVTTLQTVIFVHLMVVVVAVARQVREIREEGLRAKQALLQRAQAATVELETEVAQRTHELQQALVRADEAGRAKTDFLARVSHDLRSPMTSILGYIQLMQSSSAVTHPHMRIIRRSAEHMLHLINDLIDYARGAGSDRLEPRPTYIHAVLDAVAQEAQVLAQAGQNRFVLDIRHELPNVVSIDGRRLRQVLINLLQNAAQHTRGGLIELAIEVDEELSPPPTSPSLWLSFVIRDTGSGIAPDELSSIRRPFVRHATPPLPAQNQDNADSHRLLSGGLGLGWPIVDAWVERMGGQVSIHSQLGEGTTVRVRLPAPRAHESELPRAQAIEDQHHTLTRAGADQLIWVVEDTPSIRLLLQEALHSSGYRTRSFHDGSEAIMAMSTQPSEVPCLVLTDFRMPGADGHAVLELTRRLWPQVPVVLLSATQVAMGSAAQGANKGQREFDAQLIKPVNLAELDATLAKLLGSRGDAARVSRPPQGVASPTPNGQATLAVDSLTTIQRQIIEQLLEQGAMSELDEWALEWSRVMPGHNEVARRLRAWAASGNAPAIRQWLSGQSALD